MARFEIPLIAGAAAIIFVPQFRDAIFGFIARKQGDAVQRQLTGGKLFDEAIVDTGENFQKNVFGGLLFP